MKKIFSILFLAALVMVACENGSEEKAKPTITVTSNEVIEVAAEGDEVEIAYTIANGESPKVNISENATWIDAKQSGDVIVVTVKANETAETREAVITLNYYASSAKVTIKQMGSEYDVVFQAKRFEGIYFGTEYSTLHNYYIILSDVGVNTDASVKANGTYYYFDMYNKIAADENNPVLPDGEYKFDATNSYADKTFSEEGSWYGKTNDNGKFSTSASYKEATVVVKNGKFSATIEMENGETHYVSYEGDLVAMTHITTLSGDVEFDVKDASVTATCYGDTYEKGQQTWFIEAVKGDEYFSVEVLSPSAESYDGIYMVLAPSGVTDYANKFIPGLIGEGLIGTWYAKLTDGVIKGDVMAPMVDGLIQIITEGDAVTINYSCKDDAGNNITGSVMGNLKK